MAQAPRLERDPTSEDPGSTEGHVPAVRMDIYNIAQSIDVRADVKADYSIYVSICIYGHCQAIII